MISNQKTDQRNNLGNQFKLKNKTTTNEWKTVGVRIKSQDLPALNQRLRLYGFETLGQLVGDFLIAKFPPITEDRQIQTSGIISTPSLVTVTINNVDQPLVSDNENIATDDRDNDVTPNNTAASVNNSLTEPAPPSNANKQVTLKYSSVFFQTGSPPPDELTTPPEPEEAEEPSPRPIPAFVNNPPTANNQSVMTDSNIAVDITLTASDPDINDNLTAAVVSEPLHGTLSDIDQNLGVVTYTPNPGFTGTDEFMFKVNDGKTDSNNVGIVEITVR